MGKKGQVAIEYLLITAFAFLFTIPIIALFYSQSHELNEGISSSQAERIASELVDAANQVYYLGQPSKKTILFYMPKNVKQVTIQEKSVVLTISSTAGDYDVVKTSAANLTGSIGSFSGLHKVEVSARLLDVQITE